MMEYNMGLSVTQMQIIIIIFFHCSEHRCVYIVHPMQIIVIR